ncbi:MAG: carboxypeptidase regulatory-like domain-containing protein [Acidobacteria bacterium]|nr:carboxypeptidase regulatory-like domain-containing protein [Acidobacteriota bacterium]
MKSFLLTFVIGTILQAAAIRGTVKLQANGEVLHNITVLLLPTGRVVESNDQGKFEFTDVKAGKYTLIAVGEGLSDVRRTVDLTDKADGLVDFEMGVSPLRQELTVTATSGKAVTFLETFSPTLTLDSTTLASKAPLRVQRNRWRRQHGQRPPRSQRPGPQRHPRLRLGHRGNQ